MRLRFALFGLIALVAFGAIWQALSNPSGEGEASKATKSVTLVIDFGDDSQIQTKTIDLDNVPSDATGWQLFKLAGIPVEGTQQYPSGFVCRISAWPRVEDQDCSHTPTYKEGHWAYFVSSLETGPAWVLSGSGAAQHVPDCGGFEGWAWIAGGKDSRPPRVSVSTRACK